MDGHIDQMCVDVCPEHPRRFQAVREETDENSKEG